MELNAKLNREKEENKNINKKNNKDTDAKNKILIDNHQKGVYNIRR